MRTIFLQRRGLIQLSAILTQCCGIAYCALALCSGTAIAQTADIGGPYPVGMKQMEYVDPADGRHLAFALFYPAALADSSAAPDKMTFFTNLHLHVDAQVFVNECDGFGRDTWPEACIDAPGIDRGQLQEYIGKTALKFFDSTLGVPRGSP